MARKATPAGSATKKRPLAKRAVGAKTARRKPATAAASSRSRTDQGDFNAADALFKLLESPLVADLLAVGATAALAAIAESRYSRKSGTDARSSRALKAAGKAAAAAIGRRLATEFDEIKKASKNPRAGG